MPTIQDITDQGAPVLTTTPGTESPQAETIPDTRHNCPRQPGRGESVSKPWPHSRLPRGLFGLVYAEPSSSPSPTTDRPRRGLPKAVEATISSTALLEVLLTPLLVLVHPKYLHCQISKHRNPPFHEENGELRLIRHIGRRPLGGPATSLRGKSFSEYPTAGSNPRVGPTLWIVRVLHRTSAFRLTGLPTLLHATYLANPKSEYNWS